MSRPSNPNAGRTCDRCRQPLSRSRRGRGKTVQCERCLAERADRQRFVRAGTWIRYTPLEDILAQPTVRLLRALRWFRWVETEDLLHAAGAPASWEDRQDFAKALSRLVGDGFGERRPGARIWSRARSQEYRITEAGRAELDRRLVVDMEVAADDEEAGERSAA